MDARDRERALRETLRAAIAYLSDAKARQGRLDDTVVRARKLFAIAKDDLDHAMSSDRRIAEDRARELLSGTDDLNSSGFSPISTTDASRNLKLAEETLEVLLEESEQAATEVYVANESVKRAAAELLTLHADSLADELAAAHERARELQIQLLGLSYLSQGFGEMPNRPWQITSKVRSALNWTEPQRAPGPDPIKAASDRWGDYYRKLSSDADAGLGSLPAAVGAPSSA